MVVLTVPRILASFEHVSGFLSMQPGSVMKMLIVSLACHHKMLESLLGVLLLQVHRSPCLLHMLLKRSYLFVQSL